MANVELRNRAKMTTATVGTGTLTLGTAVTAYQSFAAAGVEDGDTVRYLIEDGNNWEYGFGVYDDGPTTLTRNVQESSDIDDLPIALTGAAIVSITVGAEDFRGKFYHWISADFMIQRNTNGPARNTVQTITNLNMMSTLDFDPGATPEHAQFSIGTPPGYNGSKMTFIPVWSHAATATNFGVSWKLKGKVFRNDEAFDLPLGTEQESADTGGVTDKIYLGPESPEITLSGSPVPGETLLVHFDIYRDGPDTQDNLAVDARLHGIYLIWSTNMATDGLGLVDGIPPP